MRRNTGVGQCFFGSRNAEMNKRVISTRLFSGHELRWIEAFDLAGNVCVEGRRIKPGDRANARATIGDRVPRGRNTNAHGAHDAQAGDDDATLSCCHGEKLFKNKKGGSLAAF